MDLNFLFLLPLLARGGSQQQRLEEFTRRLLPMALPGPAGQRLAFAAITVDQQIKREQRVQLELVKEAVKAGGFKDITELTAAAPTTANIVAGLGAADQAAIFQPLATKVKP
jgi:hypothetical protein